MPEKVKMSQEMYDMILQDSGVGHFEMSDRDSACGILPDLDYEAQLIAISALLRRNDQADAETERQIKEVDEYARKTSGWREPARAVDEWVDLLHGSTYQVAAHSMAALAQLAAWGGEGFLHKFTTGCSSWSEDRVSGPERQDRDQDAAVYGGFGGSFERPRS